MSTTIAAPTPQPICPHCGHGSGQHWGNCVVVRDKGTRWWSMALLLLLACGGAAQSADDEPEPTDVEMAPQAAAPNPLPAPAAARVQNWCCEGERFGVPALSCGWSVRPSYAHTCYCSGIVSADTESCRDPSLYTPGTLCTGSSEVCW